MLSRLEAKLRDWAMRPVRAGCYSISSTILESESYTDANFNPVTSSPRFRYNQFGELAWQKLAAASAHQGTFLSSPDTDAGVQARRDLKNSDRDIDLATMPLLADVSHQRPGRTTASRVIFLPYWVLASTSRCELPCV